MKKAVNYFSGAVLSIMLTGAVYAQTGTTGTGNTSTSMQDQSTPKAINDPAMTQRLQSDFTGRNSSLGDTQVNWMDAGYGYNATYSKDNVDYMANYDKQGNYVGSYRKGQWSEVPASLRTSFDQSQYKGQTVTGYWESADPAVRGYYLEIDNGKGRTSRVWADEKGKFSTTQPNYNKPKQ